MSYNKLLLFICAVASVSMPIQLHAEQPLEKFYEEVTSDAGTKEIFIRNRPVVLFFTGLSKSASEKVRNNVELYAKAASLPVSMSDEGTNLVLIRTNNVARGDDLNANSLGNFGLPEKVIGAMAKTKGWSTGCGGYVFKAKDGSISTSVGIIDASLSEEREGKCISLLVLHSFGIALGKDVRLPDSINPFKYAFFINILYKCARSAGDPKGLNTKLCVYKEAERIAPYQ